MGRVLLKKGTLECDIHNELYELHRNFGVPEEDNLYWDQLNNRLGEISRKYRGSEMERFTDAALIAFAEYLDSKIRKEKYTAKTVATIVCSKRSKEEIEAIIKEMREYE